MMADESSSSDYPSKGIDSSPILANSNKSQLWKTVYITKSYVAVQLPERLILSFRTINI